MFGEHIRRIEEAQARCDRLDAALAEAVETWTLAPAVRALQALRGVGLAVAATLMAEIGDLARFSHPKQLMSWLGLVPSERSSGQRTGRGAITKAGNGDARAMLAEAAAVRVLRARQDESISPHASIAIAVTARLSRLAGSNAMPAWRARMTTTPPFAPDSLPPPALLGSHRSAGTRPLAPPPEPCATRPMPIRAESRYFYPLDWPQLSQAVRFGRADGACERCGRPHGEAVWHWGETCIANRTGLWWDEGRRLWRCERGRPVDLPPLAEIRRAAFLQDDFWPEAACPVRRAADAGLRLSVVQLACCHLDHDPANNAPGNLAALCQRCHLKHDAADNLARRKANALARLTRGTPRLAL